MGKMGLGSRIRNLFSGRKIDESFFEQLEDILIEGDVGALTAVDLVDELRGTGTSDGDALRANLKERLHQLLIPVDVGLIPGKLNFFLVLGVNGVGKTTSLAKLARLFSDTYSTDKIILSAGDTFRAAAIEQLEIHGERLGFRVVSQEHGSDPGAVIFDSIDSAISRNMDLVLADTAGRMHNKQNLVQELSKIDKIIAARVDSECYHKLLVIDANTGQNGFRQAEVFNEAIGVDSVFLAKYDSSAKGGIVVAIAKQLGIPVSFVGTGEKPTDIQRFNTEQYLEELIGEE
jgi:fused signal recognition particle receptor